MTNSKSFLAIMTVSTIGFLLLGGCETSSREQALIDKTTTAGSHVEIMSSGDGEGVIAPGIQALVKESDNATLSALFRDNRFCFVSRLMLPEKVEIRYSDLCFLAAFAQNRIELDEKWKGRWRAGDDRAYFANFSDRERDEMIQSAVIKR